MSTRAVVTIKDERDEFHIYTHCDGYPEYQVKRLVDAVPFAWELPRFEAMDFAAAFVRGSKEKGGNIYLTKHWDNHGDLEFRYEVSEDKGILHIKVFDMGTSLIWEGSLVAMVKKYGDEYIKTA